MLDENFLERNPLKTAFKEKFKRTIGLLPDKTCIHFTESRMRSMNGVQTGEIAKEARVNVDLSTRKR